MFEKHSFSDYQLEHLEKALDQLYQPVQCYTYPPGYGQSLLGNLENMRKWIPERYYWVTDIRKKAIIWQAGVAENLGYSAESLSLPFSIHLIHPDFREIICWYALQLYTLSQNIRYCLKGIKITYQVEFPVQRHDNTYVIVRQYAYPFAFDQKGRMIQNLNQFQIKDRYDGQLPDIRFSLQPTDEHAIMNDLMETIHKNRSDWLVDSFPLLTDREKHLLKVLDFMPANKKKVHELMQVSKHTIKTHKKHILRKAKKQFPSLNLDFEMTIKLYQKLGLLDY